MTDYDNKEMNLEDEENVVSEETENQSLDTDTDRKKNLSFSFDKLLSSLNMNRKKRDESGLLDTYPSPEMLGREERPEEGSDLPEDTESIQVLDEAIELTEELKSEEADDSGIELEAETEAPREEEQDEVAEAEFIASITDGEEGLEETVEEVVQAGAETESQLTHEEISEPVLAEFSENTETEAEDVTNSEESESMTTQKTELETEEAKESTEETEHSLPEVEVEEEEFTYSIYQNGEGGIDYDKLVGETKLMTIDSIYSCKNLPKNLNESVFIIELYGKTLPENLPTEVKRQSVLNILQVGSLDVEFLLQDAYNRIDLLNEVLEDVAQKTEEMNETNLAEIAELNRKIEELRQTMANRAKYQQKQNTSIGYEIQRIVNIVEFINPR